MSFVVRPSPETGPLLDEREAPRSSGTRGYDVIIRTNIQTIRSNLQSIEANLRNLNRNFVSRRIVESLHDKLKQTFDFILQTEAAFNSWLEEQQQAEGRQQNTAERQKEKFLFDKLFSHFQSEIRRVQEVSEAVRSAAEKTSLTSSRGLKENEEKEDKQNKQKEEETQEKYTNIYNHDASNLILDMERAGDYEGVEGEDNLFISPETRDMTEFDFVSENDALLTRAVAEDRYQGIRRIHAQVSQANHIFKDLANLIFSQGETLNSIETQMQEAHAHSKAAAVELRQASKRQQRSRQRRCFLVLFIFALSFLILYTLNFFSLFSFFRSSSVPSEPLNVAVVDASSAAAAAAAAAAAGEAPAGAVVPGAAADAAADADAASEGAAEGAAERAAAAAPGPAAAAAAGRLPFGFTFNQTPAVSTSRSLIQSKLQQQLPSP